jgi:hypothetical protein
MTEKKNGRKRTERKGIKRREWRKREKKDLESGIKINISRNKRKYFR